MFRMIPRVFRLLATAPLVVSLAGVIAFVASCSEDPPVPLEIIIDRDQDGVPEEDDCNDEDRYVHPAFDVVAAGFEACDWIDNDCDGDTDEDFDSDDDYWTTCMGDCRDNDGRSFPGAPEMADGLDNDCDGTADNGTTTYDDDHDGYSEDQGDCNDDPLGDGALMSPGAVEVQLTSDGHAEGRDNDCDDLIDEALPPCPSGGAADDPYTFANAVDVCHFVTDARWMPNLDARGRGVFTAFGDVYVPRAGDDFMVLSSGKSGDESTPGWVATSGGTAFTVSVPHPDPQGAIGCSSADQPTVNDYNELVLQLEVPSNAHAFSFDFNFMSAEFPEWVCSSFDDTFLAMLESEAFVGNVSFDAMGNRVSINNGFFNVCEPSLDPSCQSGADLAGTGYQGSQGGGTGWLTTTAPVVPGEKVRLVFSVFDEGDHVLDSTVIVDNFRWEVEEVDGPVTVPRLFDPRPVAGSSQLVAP